MKRLNKVESRRLIRELVNKSGTYEKLGEWIQPHKPITRQAIYNWKAKGRIPDSRIIRCFWLQKHGFQDVE